MLKTHLLFLVQKEKKYVLKFQLEAQHSLYCIDQYGLCLTDLNAQDIFAATLRFRIYIRICMSE